MLARYVFSYDFKKLNNGRKSVIKGTTRTFFVTLFLTIFNFFGDEFVKLNWIFLSISLHIKVEKCEVIYNKNPKKIFKYCGFFIYCKINCFTGSIANSRRQKCGSIGKSLYCGQRGLECYFAHFIMAGFSLLLLGMH